MTRAKPVSSSIPIPVQRYGLALVSVAGALAIGRFLFSQKVEGIEFPVFLIAIALTVWYAGVGPAIVAILLSTLAFDYYFTRPYHSFLVSRADLPYYLVFILFALMITCLAPFAAALSATF
jgi:K+-sensing histidine kinase KdpD